MTSILIFKYLPFTRREITIKLSFLFDWKAIDSPGREPIKWNALFMLLNTTSPWKQGRGGCSVIVICLPRIVYKKPRESVISRRWGLYARLRWNLGIICRCIDSNFDEYRQCLKLHRKKRDRGQLHLRAVKLLLHWSRIQKVTYSQFEIFGISAICLSIATDNKRRWTFDASLLFCSLAIRDVSRSGAVTRLIKFTLSACFG